jgi:HD-like signal output (HDOD) protein
MSVRILRLANSAYFAPAQPILNVDDALIYLGLNQIRTSIMTARCIEQTCSVSSEIINWKQFWMHAVGVGVITQILSSHLKNQNMNLESYYVMGLFHDIGKLALAYLSPDDFEAVFIEAAKRHCLTSDIEVEMLGLDHASLGAWYLQQQGIPPTIFEPIRLHHAWTIGTNTTQNACLLNLADQFTHFLKLGQSGSSMPSGFSPFKSKEWEHYVSCCSLAIQTPEDHMMTISDKLIHVPDLVQNMVI